jgi:quinohemoprotein ethanol dehydrogenase
MAGTASHSQRHASVEAVSLYSIKTAIRLKRWKRRPVTYLVNGVQFVSVMAGWGGADAAFNASNRGKVKPGYGRILTFALGGTATFAVPPFGHAAPPTPALTLKASSETVHDGKLLYGANCAWCHGLEVVAGPMPDLRYATRTVHDQFEAIVLGGKRSSLGMPSFKDLLNAHQVRAIQAYILQRAGEGANPKSK